MKTALQVVIATIVLLLSPCLVQHCCGQAKSSSTPVAVVDIGYLFKNHMRFTQAMDRVKADVEASDEQFRERAKDVETRVKRLATYKSDSTEYKTLEEETARLQAQIQADVTLKRKEFLYKEANVYYAIYKEIQKEVKAFADNHGIGLVLRFSADEINSTDRTSVLQGVNRAVVYQRNLNITYDILDRLQRRAGSQRTAQAPNRGTTSQTPGTTRPPNTTRTLPRR